MKKELFDYTPAGFEKARDYLISIDKYKDVKREDGYVIVSVANIYLKQDNGQFHHSDEDEPLNRHDRDLYLEGNL